MCAGMIYCCYDRSRRERKPRGRKTQVSKQSRRLSFSRTSHFCFDLLMKREKKERTQLVSSAFESTRRTSVQCRGIYFRDFILFFHVCLSIKVDKYMNLLVFLSKKKEGKKERRRKWRAREVKTDQKNSGRHNERKEGNTNDCNEQRRDRLRKAEVSHKAFRV